MFCGSDVGSSGGRNSCGSGGRNCSGSGDSATTSSGEGSIVPEVFWVFFAAPKTQSISIFRCNSLIDSRSLSLLSLSLRSEYKGIRKCVGQQPQRGQRPIKHMEEIFHHIASFCVMSNSVTFPLQSQASGPTTLDAQPQASSHKQETWTSSC